MAHHGSAGVSWSNEEGEAKVKLTMSLEVVLKLDPLW